MTRECGISKIVRAHLEQGTLAWVNQKRAGKQEAERSENG